jgi:predicted RNase H-like HicB family nuclease
MSRRYRVVLTPEPLAGGYSVRVPALLGCVSEGETREEALAAACDAIEDWIAAAVALGRPVPEDDERLLPEVVTVAV